MRVVINAGFFSGIYVDEYQNFLQRTFERIARNQPAHEFVFLCVAKNAVPFEFAPNIKVYIVKRYVRNLLLSRYWREIRLPAILKKIKADVFLTISDESCQNTRVPQCIALLNMGYLQFPAFFTRTERLFYKRYLEKIIKKAKTIITLSAHSKQSVTTKYKVADTDIDVIYNGVNEDFKPVNQDIKSEIKLKYTGDRDYFLYSGAIHRSSNLINLLKAFSVFKKRQQTGMKLFICEKRGSTYNAIAHSLLTYKYRSDVVHLSCLDDAEFVRITASAYALIHPVFFDDFSSSVIQALHCNVPVITSPDSGMADIAGSAALYADPLNYQAIAEQLMLLYKDENLRNDLIKKAAVISQQFTWDKTAERLWQSIHKTAL